MKRLVQPYSCVNFNHPSNANLAFWFKNLPQRVATNKWIDLTGKYVGTFSPTNAPTYSNVTHIGGIGSLLFSGGSTDSYVSFPFTKVIKDFGFYAWIKISSLGQLGTVVSIGSNFFIEIEGNNPLIVSLTVGGGTCLTQVTGNFTDWFHVGISRRNGFASFYINGELTDVKSSVGNPTASSVFKIDDGDGLHGIGLGGYLDDIVCIFDRGPTDMEVLQRYMSSRNGYRDELIHNVYHKGFVAIPSSDVPPLLVKRDIFSSWIEYAQSK